MAENTSGDTVLMLRNSPHLIAIVAAYVIGLVAYNYVGQQVSPMAGVASRTWLETLRTLACWFLAGCLHYGDGSVFEGESTTWQMSAAVDGIRHGNARNAALRAGTRRSGSESLSGGCERRW